MANLRGAGQARHSITVASYRRTARLPRFDSRCFSPPPSLLSTCSAFFGSATFRMPVVRPPGAPKTLVFEDSEGPTDAEGKFTLRGVHGKAGAMAGKHTVIVTKLVTSDGKDVPPVGDQSLIAPISKQVIPPVYSDLSQTTLTADVPDKGGAVDLALRAKP